MPPFQRVKHLLLSALSRVSARNGAPIPVIEIGRLA